jgi:hypothetical protein
MASNIQQLSVNSNILPEQATSFVKTITQIKSFGVEGDYIEMNIYDLNNKFLFQVSPFLNFKIPPTSLSEDGQLTKDLDFSPDVDLNNLNITVGNFITEYNILRPKIINTNNKIFFIKEISSDRTELRISTNNIIYNEVLDNSVLSYIDEIQSLGYFKEFYINIGNGILIPAINIALDNNTSPSTVLIKLLNPLPLDIVLLTPLSVSEKISNTQKFQVSFTPDIIEEKIPSLRSANFDIELDNIRANPTQYFSLSQITDSKSSVNSQLQSLLGLVSSSQFSINIDYTNLSNFIHYSSGVNRLDGFKYKLNLIETYTAASSSAASFTTLAAQQDAQNYKNQLNGVIQSFDGYEKFLYYESSSFAWPKQNSVKPYINYASTSSQGLQWYSGSYDSASLYDINNQNYLIYALPTYINEDSSNNNLFKYVSSIGLMFDEIWLYTKAITDLYQSKNSLTDGISKDLVYFALQSMGVNVYPDQDGENVFQYLYGVTPDGKYLPNTGSYETLITASQYSMPGQDQEKGIYKRLYHNLPLLLKSKGTNRFIQYLNTIFGIPTTIMGYTEYGGVDKSTVTTEYEFDRFTYSLISNDGDVSIPWTYLSQSFNKTGFNDIVPDAIEFRFKKDSTNFLSTSSLFKCKDGPSQFFNFNLSPATTGSNNSIYSGSTGTFGYFTFNLTGSSGGASVSTTALPIFQPDSNEANWYNVLIQRRYPNRRLNETGSDQYYDIYVRNNIYGEIGHSVSASLYVTDANINRYWYEKGNKNIELGHYTGFSAENEFTGFYQELRLWSNNLSESKFNIHVLNPESIEGNTTGSSFNDLAARFTLGNNLYTYNHSVTTKIYSTHPDQNTQILTASFSNFPNQNNYSSFTETYYTNVANSGYANPVTDKVRIMSGSTYGTQLLPNKSIEVQPLLPTTKDIHLLDASLSPQDEIDRDIIASLGATYTIDDYIGDPSGDSIANLDKLRFDHFKKYKKPFNYKDYIRLIEFFHTSLFRTLKDFIPARTNVATGMVIKPNILERSTQQINDPEVNKHNNITSSIDILFITSSNGGGYTQPTYSYTIDSNLGPVSQISDGRDFFTGELPSSSIFIHDDFDIANYNPFAIGFKSNNTGSYSQSLWDIEFNPLLNNVEKNQTSDLRKKLTLIGGNSGFISGSNYTTESFDLQDFTYSYKRHINPRYIGTKVSSLKYNTYTSSSYTGSNFSIVTGDNSYGKTSAIDRNSYKLGWVKSIPSQSLNFLDKTQIQLKYLIDTESNITDLNQKNNNVFEVQNIFRSGDSVDVSLSDTTNPSFQKKLDGSKTVFAGGFSYDPILYRERNEAVSFRILDPDSSELLSFAGIKALDPFSYNYRSLGVIQSFGAFSCVPYNPQSNIDGTTRFWEWYKVTLNSIQPQSNTMANDGGFAFRYANVTNNSINKTVPPISPYTQTSNMNYYLGSGGNTWRFYEFDLLKFNNFEDPALSYNTEDQDVQPNGVLYSVPRTSNYTIKTVIPVFMKIKTFVQTPATSGQTGQAGQTFPFNFKVVGILEKSANSGVSWNYVASTKIDPSSWSVSQQDPAASLLSFNPIFNTININQSPSSHTFNFNFNCVLGEDGLSATTLNPTDYKTQIVKILTSGEILRFRFYIYDSGALLSRTDNVEFGFGTQQVDINTNSPRKFSYFEIVDKSVSTIDYNKVSTVTIPNLFLPDIFSGNKINFVPDITKYFLTSSVFVPSISTTTLNFYSQVVDDFSIKENDLIRFGSIKSSFIDYYTVLSTELLTYGQGGSLFGIAENAGFIISDNRWSDWVPLYDNNIPPLQLNQSYSTIVVPYTQQNSGFFSQVISTTDKIFTVTNTRYTSGLNLTLNKIYEADGYIYLAVSNDLRFGTTATPTIDATFGVGFSNPYIWQGGVRTVFSKTVSASTAFDKLLSVTLDRPLSTLVTSQNFAILRPKYDETSVIINYRKESGDVSQTMLIPQDASETLKNKIGDIFQKYNTDLSI